MARTGSNIRKLRADTGGDGNKSYAVGIPNEMGEMLYRNGIMEFRVEWHDDGVLLRPVRPGDIPSNMPAWVTGNGQL